MSRLLEMANITKRFPGVRALDGVNFDLQSGEVHVLLGENGAGKSTLVKMLSGAQRPDEGEIVIEGEPVRIANAAEAQRLGISAIYQEFNLVPQLSVAENIFLGRQPRRLGMFVDRRSMVRRTGEALEQLGIRLSPTASVGELGVAQRQLVEIVKAISLEARLLIMDEPTATLSGGEVEKLFSIVGDLKEQGLGIIFISHHLEEVTRIGDRITVLRDGAKVDTVPASTPHEDLIRLMVGRDIEELFPRRATEPGRTLLEVEGLGRGEELRDVSLSVRAGEVVGLAGIVGAGRTELARAIFGLDPVDSGRIMVDGELLTTRRPDRAKKAGLAFVTEDRQGQGLVPQLSVEENLTLASPGEHTRFGLVDKEIRKNRALQMIERLNIRTPGPRQQVRYLSGGNQQKVILGKWLLADAKVVIMDEPTRGVDVGAKTEIYELMNTLTADGVGILMISSDLQEILGMSDRVLVMSQGTITGELVGSEATQEKVMEFATREKEAVVE